MLDGMGRLRALAAASVLALAALGVSQAGAGGSGTASTPPQTSITVWATSATPNPYAYAQYGGYGYGGYTPMAGAMITERREVDVDQTGEIRITGIASTVDPATVQLRSLTDPTGVAVSEQRFVPGANTPDEIIARHVGEQVTVVTPKGEVIGTLRSVDPQALVIESNNALQILRRDGYVQDIRLPAGKAVDKASLVWRLVAKKLGKQTVEVTYRADGLSWAADYLAIFDEAAKTIDFSAWATLRNSTGTSFDGAELTLVSGGQTTPTVPNYNYGYGVQQPRQSAPVTRYTVPSLVHVGNGESVQVELMPTKLAAKARSVIVYNAAPQAEQQMPSYQTYPNTDCSMLSSTPAGTGRAEVAVEVDVPNGKQLPAGRVRVFRRPAKASDRLEALGEDQLDTANGVARISLAAHTELTGERKALPNSTSGMTCNVDDRARTITEKIEVKLENKAKAAADVVLREYMWRYPVWHIDPADESVKGVRAGPQLQEYRVNVPANGKKTVTYTVVYSF